MAEQLKTALAILRRKQLEARTGLARSTLYDRINPKSPRYDPTFPKPIDLGGGRAVGWLEHEVDAWIAQQTQNSRAVPANDSQAPTVRNAK